MARSLTLPPFNVTVRGLLRLLFRRASVPPRLRLPVPSLAPGGMRWGTGMPPVHPPAARSSPKLPWFGQGNGEPPPLRPAPAAEPMRKPQIWVSPRPILVPKHAEMVQSSSPGGPKAKPASSLGCSENRVHWKSAKLQYIGISICQLLNSKTDCLKTESVSYSKFTLNSSPFLHL